jgi:hypothetical protein
MRFDRRNRSKPGYEAGISRPIAVTGRIHSCNSLLLRESPPDHDSRKFFKLSSPMYRQQDIA